MIRLQVSKSYKDQEVLKELALEIESGEFVAIKGASGSGKSTLLNILGLLDLDYKGSYTLDNMNMRNIKRNELLKMRSSFISFVFQDFNLFEFLTVYENIVLPLEIHSKKIDKNEVIKLLEDLGISQFSNKKVSELSGGEKQRVAIARSIIMNPKIILADEPTGSLDEDNGNIVIEMLHDISKKRGSTVIVVTHSSVYDDYFDRVLRIKDGKISN